MQSLSQEQHSVVHMSISIDVSFDSKFLLNFHVSAPYVTVHLTIELYISRINLPLFSTVVPAIIFVFLSCRPFVAITTLSTGFVGFEVTRSC